MQLVKPSTVASRFNTTAMFRRILVPVEFNDASQCAVAEAIELRRQFGSTIHLYHRAEEDESGRFLAGTGAASDSAQALVTAAEDRLRRFMENVLPGHERDVSVHSSADIDVANGIVKEALRVDATLVLIGAERHPRLFRTQIEQVLQALDCPVLLVRPRVLA